MMTHVSVFLNNRAEPTFRMNVGLAESVANLGDFCLTPVRCLFDGKQLSFGQSWKDPTKTSVSHVKDYDSEPSFFQTKRTFLGVVKAIIFFIPGILLGSFIKGLAYCSQSIRDKHNLAVQHYTPQHRIIGTEDQRLNVSEIIQALKEERDKNHLNQKTETITIYAEKNSKLSNDLGITFDFRPKKIILDGAKFTGLGNAFLHNFETRGEAEAPRQSRREGMEPDETAFSMRPNWEATMRTSQEVQEKEFITQWKVNSHRQALSDTPPRKFFPLPERYNRIYLVQ